MPKPPASNGSAEIQAQGQTSVPEFGVDPNFKGTYSGGKKPTDLKLKQSMAGQQQKQGTNTVLEGLSQTMGQLASLSVLPDAQPHVGFLNAVMMEIQKYLHKPQVAGAALGPAGPPGAGGPGGPPPGGPQGGPPPGGMPGGQPATPPVDELRRMLGANATAA